MRTIDLTPLYRSSVGFDRMANLMDSMLSADGAAQSYPPYNIEKTGDDAYRITVAVAGFAEDEISIESKESELVISAAKTEKSANGDDRTMLYRGIAERSFERRFKLADHVRATGAKLENGLLHVELVREVPEALKPRKIAISAGSAAIEDARVS
ncbi:MAG: Hsp20 family protein [Pseudomonadota bacterium]